MRIRSRAARIQTQKARREAHFQRQLEIAFRRLPKGQRGEGKLKFIDKRGFEFFALFAKVSIETNYVKLSEAIKGCLEVAGGSDDCAFQINEWLKNICDYGGDALICARRCFAFRQGQRRELLEVVLWDNGRGIKDVRKVVAYGWSSRDGRLGMGRTGRKGRGFDYYGSGELDYFRLGIESYYADEIIIESGRQVAFRRHNTDSHHFRVSAKNVPGTKVTTRFWL